MKSQFVCLLSALMISSCLSTKHGEAQVSGRGQADVTINSKVVFEKKDGKIITTNSGSIDGALSGNVAAGYKYGEDGSSHGKNVAFGGEKNFGKGKPDDLSLSDELSLMNQFAKDSRDDFSRNTFEKKFNEFSYENNRKE